MFIHSAPHGMILTAVVFLVSTLPAARARRQWFGRHRLPDESVDRVKGEGGGHQSQQARRAKQHQAKDQRGSDKQYMSWDGDGLNDG